MNIFDWRSRYSWRLSWRLWKWRNWCIREDLIFMREIWSLKTFVFIVLFFSFLSHRKHRTVKGGRGNTKETFPSDAQLKILHLQSLRVKPLEISYSSVNFFSDRDEDLLVSEKFVLTEELGIHQCGLPASEEHDSPEEFDTQISDRCCATHQLSQNIYPPNGHIIEGHLCLIMSGCSLGNK